MSPALRSPRPSQHTHKHLIDLNIASTFGNGQAILGGTSDTYNNIGSSGNTVAAGTLFTDAETASGGHSGIAISTTSGFNVYQTSGGTTANPDFLMDGYAYSAQNGQGGVVTAPINFTLTGLSAYTGDSFTLVVYGAGNNTGNGDLITLGGTSTATGKTTGVDRDITQGVGDAYQTFTGTVTGDSLTITASPNDTATGEDFQGPFDQVNGLQLQLTAAATPEPSAWAMIVGGLGLLIGVARFRRHARV